MKNERSILLLVCSLSLMLVLGIFIGRNWNTKVVPLSENNTPLPESVTAEMPAYRLDINTATQNQFMELPGIGEIIADRIIAYRDENGAFTSIDELLYVDGIGEAKLQQIERFIRIGG